MLCGVVGGVWYDGVSESGFSVDGCFEDCGGFRYGDVQVVQSVVLF